MKLSPVQRRLLEAIKRKGIWYATPQEERSIRILLKKGLVYETSQSIYKTTAAGDAITR